VNSYFKVGDLVQHSTMFTREDFRLGMVIKVDKEANTYKILWCSGKVSFHTQYFLKRIA